MPVVFAKTDLHLNQQSNMPTFIPWKYRDLNKVLSKILISVLSLCDQTFGCNDFFSEIAHLI